MTLQAGTVLVFGIDTPLTSYGLLQSYNITDQTERATARGAAGATVSTQEFDPTKSLTLNYLPVGTPTGGPAVGTKFTFETIDWQIDTLDTGDVVDGWETVDITATSYPSATIA
jgi:hypothetical protein